MYIANIQGLHKILLMLQAVCQGNKTVALKVKIRQGIDFEKYLKIHKLPFILYLYNTKIITKKLTLSMYKCYSIAKSPLTVLK